jgi:hypothetical protein
MQKALGIAVELFGLLLAIITLSSWHSIGLFFATIASLPLPDNSQLLLALVVALTEVLIHHSYSKKGL